MLFALAPLRASIIPEIVGLDDAPPTSCEDTGILYSNVNSVTMREKFVFSKNRKNFRELEEVKIQGIEDHKHAVLVYEDIEQSKNAGDGAVERIRPRGRRQRTPSFPLFVCHCRSKMQNSKGGNADAS